MSDDNVTPIVDVGPVHLTRVVVQHTPTLFAILGLVDAASAFPIDICVDDQRFYRAETHNHYVLYKAAISGWGAAAPNPEDPTPVFAPDQR